MVRILFVKDCGGKSGDVIAEIGWPRCCILRKSRSVGGEQGARCFFKPGLIA